MHGETVKFKRKTIRTYSLNKITVNYKSQSTQCLLSLRNKRISKLLHEYTPTGRRNIGRIRKRWTNHTYQDETGLQ